MCKKSRPIMQSVEGLTGTNPDLMYTIDISLFCPSQVRLAEMALDLLVEAFCRSKDPKEALNMTVFAKHTTLFVKKFI